MFRAHLLFDTARTETPPSATNKQSSFIDGITQGITRIATNHQVPSLSHKRAHVAGLTLYDDVDPFHGNAIPCCRIPVGYAVAAAPARTGASAPAAIHEYIPWHHLFSAAPRDLLVNAPR